MENSLYSKVFKWLFIGLLITFITGYGALTSEKMLSLIFSGKTYMIIFIAQIVLCIALGVRIRSMNPTLTKVLYILYSFITGLTFSSIFIVFDMSSIIMIFLATALIFGIFAIIGKNLKVDLTKFGVYLFMALLAIIVLEIINIFWANSSLDMFLSSVCIFIFMAYICYDVQKINSYENMDMDEDNIAVIGAFELYLDFINIFIRLLDLFGREK